MIIADDENAGLGGSHNASNGAARDSLIPSIPMATECLDFRSSKVPVCGRDHELGVLRSAYDRIAGIQCPPIAASVLIRGESGSGKSALMRAFSSYAETNHRSGPEWATSAHLLSWKV
jgi:AAA ATPase domain